MKPATKVTAFLPCRAGSERVKHKNTRPFAGHDGGLTAIKLRQLDRAECVDEILLSTNDPIVIETAERAKLSTPLVIHRRDDRLATSLTTTDDVIRHAIALIDKPCDVLWTHVTAPFVDAASYDEAIRAFRATTDRDSLMSVTPIRTFVWNDDGALNYDRAVEKWPRTQTLPPVYAVNSAMFLCPIDIMRHRDDRIGDRPLLYELDAIRSVDIDWEEDFMLAELIAAGPGRGFIG